MKYLCNPAPPIHCWWKYTMVHPLWGKKLPVLAAAAEVVDTQLMFGVGLMEKDTNGEVLWVWCYPSTTATFKGICC